MRDEILEALNKAVLEAFEAVGSDIAEVEEVSAGHTMDSWRSWRMVMAGSLAAPSLMPAGPLSYALLVPELALLIRFLRNSALGVGFIMRGQAAAEDFPGIMVWASEDDQTRRGLVTSATASAKVMAAKLGASALGPAATSKLLASAVVGQLTAAAHVPVNAFAAQKGAAWLAKLLAGPALARWIPFVGFGVGAGANAFVTYRIIDAAVGYYGVVEDVADASGLD